MGSNASYDVVVVGAGPAGSSAAFELARNGLNVALVEKASMPRYKTCGGGVVARALKLLPFDASEAIERQCHAAELNLGHSDLCFRIKRDYPLVSMTMRENFDHLLFTAAGKAGARMLDDHRVLDVLSRNGETEVVTDKGSLRCRFIVGADGAQSIVARKGGWTKRMLVSPLVEWEVTVDPKLLSAFSSSARFEFGPVPSGYAWVFPKREHLSIGLGGYERGKLDLKARLDRFLQALGVTPVEKVERHGYFIPVRPRDEGFAKGHVLLVGDAAGFVDPVTGEGITYAILSGQAAARALIKGDLAPLPVREAYLSELGPGVLKELNWGRILAALFYRSPKVRTLVFRQYGQQLVEAFADIISGETTYAELCQKHTGILRLYRVLKTVMGK
jgi:geranylgeranyl reductase family protein